MLLITIFFGCIPHEHTAKKVLIFCQHENLCLCQLPIHEKKVLVIFRASTIGKVCFMWDKVGRVLPKKEEKVGFFQLLFVDLRPPWDITDMHSETSTLSQRKGRAPQPSITFSCQAGGGWWWGGRGEGGPPR